MSHKNQPVYMIGVAASLCKIHPQTLRQYEKLGLIFPHRVGAKNRLYSELDIQKVHSIQRLTQELGVNLAGVEIILKLLDDMEEMRTQMDNDLNEYQILMEERIKNLLQGSERGLLKKDESLLPVPRMKWKKIDL